MTVLSAFAADPESVAVGEFVSVGDQVGEASVVEVLRHPEFERVRLADAAGAQMIAEIVRSDGVHHGQCEAGGRTLFPRPELVVGPVGRIPLDLLCARLADRTVAAPSRGWALACLSVVALGAAVGGAFRLRGRAGLVLGVFLVALAVRYGFTQPTLFNGGGAGYEKLLIGLGLSRATGGGEGYALWMAPGVRLLGGHPDAVFNTNLVFASVWPALVAAVGAREGGPRVGWAAGIAAAFLPIHTALSWSEAQHVSAITWGTLALFAAGELREDRSYLSAAIAAAAGAAAVATRGDLLPVAPLIVALASVSGAKRGWLPWGAAGLVVAGFALWGGEAGNALRPGPGIDPSALVATLLPRFGEPDVSSGFFLTAHAGFTPALWWALAAVGLWTGKGRRGLAWAILAALPFVLKVAPLPDAMRLQAFAQGGFILLVALGVARMRILGWPILALGVVVGPDLSGPRWAHREEWTFLARTTPTLAATETVALPPGVPKADALVGVMHTLGPARWVDSGIGTLVYRSAGTPPVGGEPEHEARVESGVDVDAMGKTPPFVMGFYRPQGP